MTHKRLISGIVFFAIFFAFNVSATVKPSLETMVRYSDIIIVGKIIHVENLNELTQVITIKSHNLLKGNSDTLESTFKFNYTLGLGRASKGNIKFLSLLQNNIERVIFLKEVRESENKVRLTDGWFGIEPANSDIINTIKKTVINPT